MINKIWLNYIYFEDEVAESVLLEFLLTTMYTSRSYCLWVCFIEEHQSRKTSKCHVLFAMEKMQNFNFYMLEWFRKNLYNDLCYSIMQQGIELVAGCDFSNFVSFWKVSLNKRSHRKQKKSRRVKVNNPWKNHSQLKSSKGDLIILKSKFKFNLLQFSVSPRLVTFGLYKNFFIEI